jgi:DNA polymerase-1
VVKRAIQPKLDALFFFDYKQIEPRLLAFYLAALGHDRLAEYLRTGIDPYTAIAIGYFGKEKLEDSERQLAKQTFLSLSYGGGLPAIRRYFADLDWRGAKRVKDQFYESWAEIQDLQAQIDRRLDTRGYITTLFGRHLHPKSRHKALNALIQGCAADLMRWALVEVDKGLEESLALSHIVETTHDEIGIDTIFEEINLVVNNVPKWMDYPEVSEVVPILVDIDWSTDNWGDKETYKGEYASSRV